MKNLNRGFALLGIVLLFALSVAGQWHGFWGNDEVREAEIAREIYVSGDWVVPRLNGEPFLEKPPLAHWGAALLFRFLGHPSERWCRVPSAVWGFAGLLATAWLGAMLAGSMAIGFLAAFVLATTNEWLHITHYLLVDVPLASCVIFAFTLFWSGYTSSGWWKRLSYFGCALAAGGAFMAKGTVGVIILASALAVFILRQRAWKELIRLLAPWNILAAAAIPVSWLVMLYARGGGEAIRIFAVDNQILRFISPSADHAHRMGYYLPIIFEITLPWAIFLPIAILRLVRPGGVSVSSAECRRYLICMVFIPFVVLSMASGKRHLYLMPLLPGVAIAVAAWLAGPSWPKWESLWRRLGLMLFTILPLGIWGYALILAVKFRFGIAPALGGMALSIIASIVFCMRWRGGNPVRAWQAVAMLIIAYLAVLSPALWDQAESKRGFGKLKQLVDSEVGVDDVLYGYQSAEQERAVIAFHRGRIFPLVQTPDDMTRILRESPRNVMLMADKAYQQLREENIMPPDIRIVARAKYRRKNQLLLRRISPAGAQ